MENEWQELLHRFGTEGISDADRFLGCHRVGRRRVFRVWAPKALAVSVVGDFNFWNEGDLPMKPIGGGVWEAVSRFAKPGQAYKYVVTARNGKRVYKSDPYGFACERLPGTSSLIVSEGRYHWKDQRWRSRKQEPLHAPVNIYELHAGSWKRHEDGSFLTYDELAAELVPYVREMGYTHIELLPLSEYPYDPSWGYQVTGYFAPTHRYGEPDGLRRLVDACHQAEIGVILDWVPAHFPKDENGLYEFDGESCYELSDPKMREHPDWGTRIFDYGKPEVRSFLISAACRWLREFHIDGIRVDAVASMLYLDYNRQDYTPNRYGGRENLEAIAFLRQLNEAAFAVNPGVLMIAEESTSFPMITKPGYDGGLGFLCKWNMGWMNDMLRYMALDPLYRKGSHNALTFSMMYAYSENFILPLSHDEVVYGKRSLIAKMPGEYNDKFANLRTFFCYQMAHPGKKLNFMGSEFAQFSEWDFQKGLDWLLLGYEKHRQMQDFVRELNAFYKKNSPLWENDTDWTGFRWVSCDDSASSVVAFRRIDRKGHELLAIFNFCPVLRENYVLPLPEKGWYTPVFQTDEQRFGGGGCLAVPVRSVEQPAHSGVFRGAFRLPPLSAVFYKHTARKPR